MPFLPTEGNGIVHAIIKCFSSYNKKVVPKEPLLDAKSPQYVTDINKKLDIIIKNLNP